MLRQVTIENNPFSCNSILTQKLSSMNPSIVFSFSANSIDCSLINPTTTAQQTITTTPFSVSLITTSSTRVTPSGKLK